MSGNPSVFKGVKETELTKIIENKLGNTGRLISWSKSTYRRENPDNKIYFNACIFDELLTEIWFGDIDLTKEMDTLKEIASICEQPFYVTPEHPFRADFHKMDFADIEKDERIIKFNSMERKS